MHLGLQPNTAACPLLPYSSWTVSWPRSGIDSPCHLRGGGLEGLWNPVVRVLAVLSTAQRLGSPSDSRKRRDQSEPFLLVGAQQAGF